MINKTTAATPSISPREELGAPSGKPQISIIVPVRERRHELGRLLKSLSAQDCADQLEVVVADNPLPSNRDWLRAESWPFPVGYVHVTAPNPGLSRNAGAAVAQGEWLLFVDSDVVFSACAVSAMLRDATVLSRTIVIPNVLFPHSDPRTLGTHLFDVPAYFRQYRRHRRSSELTFLQFVSCCFLMRRNDFADLGGFDPGFLRYAYEDVEFGYRAQQVSMRFELCSTARVFHKKHLDGSGILQRATDAGTSAVHMVDLHPEIESVLPLGVANTINGTLPAREPFDLTATLERAEAIERNWAGLRDLGWVPERRTLIEGARSVYKDIHRHGHLGGVAAEINRRRDVAS